MNPRLVAIAGLGAFVLVLVLWLRPDDTPVSPPEPRAPRPVPAVPAAAGRQRVAGATVPTGDARFERLWGDSSCGDANAAAGTGGQR